jgi:hypothetical protein
MLPRILQSFSEQFLPMKGSTSQEDGNFKSGNSVIPNVRSTIKYLCPSIPRAFKICQYVLIAGVAVKIGAVSTRAIVLGGLAYGAYLVVNKMNRTRAPIRSITQQASVLPQLPNNTTTPSLHNSEKGNIPSQFQQLVQIIVHPPL